MKDWKSHFRFNKQERSGIFYLLLFIFLVQAFNFFLKSYNFDQAGHGFELDEESQAMIDSLMKVEAKRSNPIIKPFNPNYISDYRGYVLGMSTEEIDRLHQFRDAGRFVNSLSEFQKVTLVSDSLLKGISSYFKFPERSFRQPAFEIEKEIDAADARTISLDLQSGDLNRVGIAELMAVPGIGTVLSRRIVKFWNALGGFLADEQLYDVYGLDSSVVKKLLKVYRVEEPPQIHPINLNKASAYELSQIVYITSGMADRIVRFRDSIGAFESLNELTKIQDFPKNKINRIKLYLTL